MSLGKAKKSLSEYSTGELVMFRFRKNKLAMFGVVLLSIIVITILLAPLISSYDAVVEMNMADRFQSPNAKYLFGTDEFGRDLFARILYGGIQIDHRPFGGITGINRNPFVPYAELPTAVFLSPHLIFPLVSLPILSYSLAALLLSLSYSLAIPFPAPSPFLFLLPRRSLSYSLEKPRCSPGCTPCCGLPYLPYCPST